MILYLAKAGPASLYIYGAMRFRPCGTVAFVISFFLKLISSTRPHSKTNQRALVARVVCLLCLGHVAAMAGIPECRFLLAHVGRKKKTAAPDLQ